MSGKQKPNLGRYDNPPDWNETLQYFRGSELQNYLTKVVEDNLKAVVKPQYVDKLPTVIKSKERTVGGLLKMQNQQGNMEAMIEVLGISASMHTLLLLTDWTLRTSTSFGQRYGAALWWRAPKICNSHCLCTESRCVGLPRMRTGLRGL